MQHVQALDAQRRLSAALVTGFGAGLAGAAAAVAAELALSVRFPLPADTAVPAFFAGVAGGLLYAVLVGNVRRPVSVLWVLSLGFATVDSLLIALLPLPAGPGLQGGLPIDGLIIPIEQIGALFGVRHFRTDTLPCGVPSRGRAPALPPRDRGGSSRPTLGPLSRRGRDLGVLEPRNPIVARRCTERA